MKSSFDIDVTAAKLAHAIEVSPGLSSLDRGVISFAGNTAIFGRHAETEEGEKTEADVLEELLAEHELPLLAASENIESGGVWVMIVESSDVELLQCIHCLACREALDESNAYGPMQRLLAREAVDLTLI